jgi:hypothetical protein
MPVRFQASQALLLPVGEEPVPIAHYLRQPQRLVYALVDPDRVRMLADGMFQLQIRSLRFMHLTLQPTAYLQITSESDAAVKIRSTQCELRGFDYLDRRFQLDLQGSLSPVAKSDGTYLVGKADLQVSVELPPPFCFTPTAIVEATGNGLLKSVLATIEQRLGQQLLKDYRHWIDSQPTPERLPAQNWWKNPV